jgi:hypothetical protein
MDLKKSSFRRGQIYYMLRIPVKCGYTMRAYGLRDFAETKTLGRCISETNDILISNIFLMQMSPHESF